MGKRASPACPSERTIFGMRTSSDPNAGSTSVAQAAPATRMRPREDKRPKLLAHYAVILHNDPMNGFDFVVEVLMKVFRYASGRAIWVTLRAHEDGQCVVWTGSLEVAELKVEQIRSAGPDPRVRAGGCQPLKATAEPMPG